MSQVRVLDKLIPYVRTKIESLGYKEHVDEYDQNNIASTVINKTFMMTPGTLTSSRSSHQSYEWTFPLEIVIWYKGYLKPSEAVEYAIENVEIVLDELLDVSSRYSVVGLSDIYPESIDFEPISESNDSIIKATIGIVGVLQMYNNKNC